MTSNAGAAATVATTRWEPRGPFAREHLLPILDAADVVPLRADADVWDMWQLQRPDGGTALVDGRAWWFFLGAPRAADPEARHDVARIRLFSRDEDGWRDLGVALPDGLAPGSREWSGSAVLDDDEQGLRLFFTAAGRPNGGARFEQRLFETSARLADGKPSGWTTPVETVRADEVRYARAADERPTRGMIRGFRDPGYFRDPRDGAEYLTFTGTAAGADSLWDGVIGLARRTPHGWSLCDPLIDATGVNKELERPQILFVDGLYYLFWSTHAHRFAPPLACPTGLYGMVAPSVTGPWSPLNGTSLVAANPPEEPVQAYCWWVTGELEVLSFVNYWGVGLRSVEADLDLARRQFGGTVAPAFRLRLAGDRARPDVPDRP